MESLRSWSGPPRLFIRVEFGNIRWLGEATHRPGEEPSATILRAVSRLQTAATHGGVLQANWAYPLYLSAALVHQKASLFPAVSEGNGRSMLSLLNSALPDLETHEQNGSLCIRNGRARDWMPGGYEMTDFWYPSRDRGKER